MPSEALAPSSAALHDAPAPALWALVLTVSDTRTLENDASGAYLQAALSAGGHAVTRRLVPDEPERISAALKDLSSFELVLSTGGTGIAGRDVTVPIVEALLTQPLPGFGELFRMVSFEEIGPSAMLSRAVGGLAEHTLLFALPGSLNAVQTAWTRLLRPTLGHLCKEVQKGRAPKP